MLTASASIDYSAPKTLVVHIRHSQMPQIWLLAKDGLDEQPENKENSRR